jgi:hypothetical protein
MESDQGISVHELGKQFVVTSRDDDSWRRFSAWRLFGH